MMPQLPERMSEEEYLAFERASETKHEYRQGEIFAMTRPGFAHAQIVTNTVVAVGQRRLPTYRVLSTNMRVKASKAKLYTYPDIIVVVGQPQLEDNQRDTLLNPTIIIEVLSPSTEAYDRGKKFGHYRTLESLQEYVLIAQDAPLVEHFVRQEDGSWRFAAASGLDASLHLPTIDCTLALADIYLLVEWDEA